MPLEIEPVEQRFMDHRPIEKQILAAIVHVSDTHFGQNTSFVVTPTGFEPVFQP